MPIKVRENNTWVQVSSANGANGANGLDGVENVLQVKYRESNAVVTIAQQNLYPIFGLGVNISPLSGTSKLLLEANIMTNAYYGSCFGFALLQGLTYTRIGGNTDPNSSNRASTNVIATIFSYGIRYADVTDPVTTPFDGSGVSMYSLKYRYLYTQSGLTPAGGLTFAPTACSQWQGTTYTLTINNREYFADMLSTSSITVTEIEV